jgi:hypothetical protein
MSHRAENFRPNTRIVDLIPDEDTVYIKKGSEFPITFLCTFVKFERGLVHGRIISPDQKCLEIPEGFDHKHATGKIITAKVDSCYLWGIDPDAGRGVSSSPRCQWFKTKNLPAGLG